jgi:GGDEF domain-containing protein
MSDILAGSGFELGIAQAAITTLATILTIGIAFLVRPSAATLYWAFAFVLAMAATYGVVMGDLSDNETLRRASLGALLGAPALLWSGFRAHWGLRPHVWAGPALAMASAVALALAPSQAWFVWGYRTAFLAASVFAGLFLVDWVRVPARRHDRLLLPLAIVSAAFVVVGLASFVAGFLFPPSDGDDFVLQRMISSIGMLAYVGCALVAVVGLPARDAAFSPNTGGATPEWQRFEQTASERLLRAQMTAETWSVVYLRLDDAIDIRQTAGASAFARLSTRFEEEVRATFPAESDVVAPSPGSVVALVPRPDATVRESLRATLERVPQLDAAGSLPIRPTASAGWAPATILGYDLDALVYTAREAAVLASEKGGDRWERVSATVVDRLISRSERR